LAPPPTRVAGPSPAGLPSFLFDPAYLFISRADPGAPQLSSTFADLGVPAGLVRLLANRGIDEPFPIQTATLPDALAGRDICGKAPTGSGKTLAFGLAVAARTKSVPARPRRPRALILVPTRELAAQVAGELAALQTARGQHVVSVYGGAGYGPQRKALSQGANTVVACPGRLEDLMMQGDISLDEVEIVVLDEADRMADMGFMPAVRRILDRTSPKRQTLLFSATLDGEVDKLVRSYQRNPAHHEVKADESDGSEVTHVFWRTPLAGRTGLAAALIHRHGRAIVFCRTKRGADRLAKQLGTAGVGAAAIHGNRSQAQRERALAAFMTGRVDALVATDVAARGIHVDAVPCVIHYDLPDDPKDYVHRSGRTGRAGLSGTVVSLVPNEQRKALRIIQRTLGMPEGMVVPEASDTVVPDRPPVTVDLDKPQPRKRNRTDSKHRTGRGPGAGGGGHQRRNDGPNNRKKRRAHLQDGEARTADTSTGESRSRTNGSDPWDNRGSDDSPWADNRPARTKRNGSKPEGDGRQGNRSRPAYRPDGDARSADGRPPRKPRKPAGGDRPGGRGATSNPRSGGANGQRSRTGKPPAGAAARGRR
jgi:superfamily II DNA/RNA helicase